MIAERKIKSRWVDAVTAMIALTQEGKLEWRALSSATTSHDDKNRTTAVFEANYNGKKLRLYEISEVVESRPVDRALLGVFYSSLYGQEKGGWRRDAILELVNEEGLALWTFPRNSALSDLLTAVQYQVAGANEFIDEIISEARVVSGPMVVKPANDAAGESRRQLDAVNQIVSVIDDESMDEKERLKRARALAVNILLKPEF